MQREPSENQPLRRASERARALTLEIAAEARAEWGFATDILARAFRENRQLSSTERRWVSETTYALLRGERRLSAIVDEIVAGNPRARRDGITATARQALMLLVCEVRAGLPVEATKVDVRKALGYELDLAPALGEDAGLGNATGLERDALRVSFPTWLVERFVESHGRDAALAMCEAMNTRAPMCVRANTCKHSRDELAARLADERVTALPTRFSPAGLVFETRVNAFALSAFKDGLFEVMDEGSQIVAEAVAPPPKGKVVDACAGAGGKTLAIAAIMENQGRILAMDSNGRKLEELRRRARRAGLSNVAAREVKGAVLPDEAKLGAWDRVLVDAPCSGLGTLRRNPEARWRLTPQVVDRFPMEQLGLLVTYAPLVATGGRLIYATCTVTKQENEEVVARFLAERPDFVAMPMKEIWGKERALQLGDGTYVRMYPHTHDTDGFFAAVLRRIGS